MDEANLEDDGLLVARFFQIRAYDGDEKHFYLDTICTSERRAARRARAIVRRLRRRDFPRGDEVSVTVHRITIHAETANALAARAMWVGVALHGSGAFCPDNNPPGTSAETEVAACQTEIDDLFRARKRLKTGR
jgi:hypothetical protein